MLIKHIKFKICSIYSFYSETIKIEKVFFQYFKSFDICLVISLFPVSKVIFNVIYISTNIYVSATLIHHVQPQVSYGYEFIKNLILRKSSGCLQFEISYIVYLLLFVRYVLLSLYVNKHNKVVCVLYILQSLLNVYQHITNRRMQELKKTQQIILICEIFSLVHSYKVSMPIYVPILCGNFMISY